MENLRFKLGIFERYKNLIIYMCSFSYYWTKLNTIECYNKEVSKTITGLWFDFLGNIFKS